MKKEKAVKQEGRKTRAGRVQQQQEEEEEADEDDEAEPEEEDGAHFGTAKGAKRRRINGDGDSIPKSVGSQIPKHEFKTLPRGEDGYIPGSIVRVQLKNFVTYDYVEFRPGPYLNMIIGPNGTGKSSIACAICLGLNFPPSVLGRADKIREFVKIGTKAGHIEIELKGPKGKPNLVIRRSIKSDSDASSFVLNGKSVSGQDIKLRMAELNVQVGNLCTFLPQDKVSSFAAMSPQELLKETQRAAGDDRLTQWQSQLIKAGNDLRDLKQKQGIDETSKTQAQQRVDMMEHTVRLFNERKELEKQEEILKCVIDVEKYRVSHVEYARLKKQHRLLNGRVKRLKAKNDPVRARLQEMKEHAVMLEKRVKTGYEAQSKRRGKFNDVQADLDKLEDDIDEQWQKIENLKKAGAERLREIKKVESEVDATQKEKAKPAREMFDTTEIKALEDQAQNDKIALDHRHTDLKQEYRTHTDRRARAVVELDNAQKRIKSFDNVDSIKLQNMLKWHRDTHDAILWLRQNRNLFKMEVFEPPYMCMTVPNPAYQDAVEALVNSAQLRTFVAQCKEDVDTLNKYINDTHGLGRRARIVTWFREYHEQQLAPLPMTREELQQLGFDGYALDYVDCPEGLKWFLMRECNFHRNAIALNQRNVDVRQAMEAVGRHGGGASFITGRVMHQVSRSRYGSRALNNMTKDIPKARNLTVQTVEPEVRRQAEETVRQCQQELGLFDEERKELDARQVRMKGEDVEIEERLGEVKKRKEHNRGVEKQKVQLETRLRRLQGQLTTLKNQPSEEQQRKKWQSRLVQMNFQRAEKIKEITALMRKFVPEHQELVLLKLELLQTTANVSAIDDLVNRKDIKFQEAYAAYMDVDSQYKKIKTKSAELLVQAKAALAECIPSAKMEAERIIEVRKKYFDQLAEYEGALEKVGGDLRELERRGIEKPEPGEDVEEGDLRSLEELEVACQTVQEQMEYNNNRDESVVRSYEEKKNLVDQLTTVMEQRQEKINDTENRVQRTRNQWEPALRALITEIRDKFSKAFDRIGCAGDVELMPDPDFAQWRVDIKVKFRDNEKLQLLTGQRQSGGERSLTTILYLMSLTSLAHTPFSLVDEINQGMDKRAERMVHNSMVDVTCKEDSSQYFLITPKLLPDLKYHARMKVLCVNNGEWLPDGVSGSMRGMLRGYVAHQAAGGRAEA
ncbi:P-loop containing nucleoside triphosphate hydrolase protein [Macrolepiota fuliginosa MF-IS2]|uniref:Structural maintenance of chromosomes protein 5 n=1 Tax=Macrolepiota fuliginosa MF-IS2 TaxID=1400762 RepID=A0A9P6C204_9AGAR|nr:P-loop containing nucleoside triphosphate hydrolase protein [Macrolepiota fuliginosa MF-IS2]